MWTKQEQIEIEKYLIKYLASRSQEQEIIINSRQLLTLNQIIIDKIMKKK